MDLTPMHSRRHQLFTKHGSTCFQSHGRMQVLTDGQATIRRETADVRRSIADAERQTVIRIEDAKTDLEPELRKWDKMCGMNQGSVRAEMGGNVGRGGAGRGGEGLAGGRAGVHDCLTGYLPVALATVSLLIQSIIQLQGQQPAAGAQVIPTCLPC